LSGPLEAKHAADFVHFADRAAESNAVFQLDKCACYITWDPLRMPPHLKKLLEGRWSDKWTSEKATPLRNIDFEADDAIIEERPPRGSWEMNEDW